VASGLGRRLADSPEVYAYQLASGICFRR